MARIPEETIEQVLAATDIVDLVGSYFPLKRAGANFKALCPFHNEKSPSFMVNPARQSFHCFGCGEGGSALGFVMKYENLPFPDAVKKLAGRAGIQIIEEFDPEAEKKRRSRGRLLDLHREIARFLHQLLLEDPAAEHAREYLRGRGFGSEMAERWTVGWMPESPKTFLDWARKAGFSGRDLVGSGIASLRDDENPRAGLYLRFRDRLMFPIRNDYGDVIAFSGRQLREDPNSGKYINSPETALFEKSRVLFALDRARRPILKAGCALLCEGQIDSIACHENGIEHAIAPLGTAFTPHHARLLRRYTEKVLICYDADSAGFKAARRAFVELAGEGLEIRVVAMPAGDDPDSLIQRDGTEAFQQRLDQAAPFFDFQLDHLAAEGRLGSATDRATVARELAPLLAVVSDPVSRDTMMNVVATRLKIGTAEIRSAVAGTPKNRNPARFERPAEDSGPAVIPTPIDPTAAYLCHLTLADGPVRDWLAGQFETIHEAGQFLEGVALLEILLARDFEPGNPASVHMVIDTLDPADRLALHNDTTFFDDPPDDPLDAAQSALGRLSAKALFRRDEQIKSELGSGDLPRERMLALLEEAREVRTLLDGIETRFVSNDRPVNRPQIEEKDHRKGRKDWRQRNP